MRSVFCNSCCQPSRHVEGHTAVVKALAEAGMDTDHVASGQRTALIIAATNGYDDVVKAVFTLGVE
jgi:ankyrin repeat protein